ncbi:hypothetical protein [Photobacterium damselae]|uniref:DUF4393 domain-containing protein n=2 Tax=Photobacterium damselae TaxID=38293 RepID=D0YYQ5_PHODD|nr:hypothetical protein [Photobacterium damselae]EEZ41386.1 hypothetical protein VDA_002418 [Photobacterium damselae subsp. damselae CIP 102761]PSW87103.1 hypothetical protein CTN07_00805 [Photobacterium damselae]SPY27824.1 Uncharacterised protein [Photobacterium damselae]
MTKMTLGSAMSKTVKSEKPLDLLADISDIILSELASSLESLPIFGLLFKGYNALNTIQGEISARKIYNFFYEIQNLRLEDKAKVMDEISRSKGGGDEAGLLLLDLVDKSDDNLKPKLIGKLFVACAFCEITTQQFLRLSSVVNNVFIDDLQKLKEVYEHNALSDQLKSIYTANGLMEISIKKPQKFSQGYTMSELGDAIFNQGLALEYSLTDDGKLLAKVCFETTEKIGNTLEKFGV